MGLKPDEVLDMSMDTLKACIDGYKDRLTDFEILAVQQGYYAGYYVRARKPKALKTILHSILRSREKDSSTSTHKADVDVEAFQMMEAQFEERKRKLNL